MYNTLNLREEEAVKDVLPAFEAYCLPKKNTVFERHQFWMYPMTASVFINKYVTELRQKSKDCEFGASENDMIRDKIVFSMNDQYLKERLLREPNLTLEKTIDTCHAAEIASAQIQAMSAATQERFVHAVHKKKQDSQPRNKGPKQYTQISGHVNMSRKCGKSHQPKQCPVYGFSCHKCSKQNHNAKMCGTGKAQHRRTVHDISPEIDTLFIGTVNIDQLNSSLDKSWYSEVRLDNMSIRFKLDTGAVSYH